MNYEQTQPQTEAGSLPVWIPLRKRKRNIGCQNFMATKENLRKDIQNICIRSGYMFWLKCFSLINFPIPQTITFYMWTRMHLIYFLLVNWLLQSKVCIKSNTVLKLPALWNICILWTNLFQIMTIIKLRELFDNFPKTTDHFLSF